MISSLSFLVTSLGPLFVINNIAAPIYNIGIMDSRVSFDIRLTSKVPTLDPIKESTKYSVFFFSTSKPFL